MRHLFAIFRASFIDKNLAAILARATHITLTILMIFEISYDILVGLGAAFSRLNATSRGRTKQGFRWVVHVVLVINIVEVDFFEAAQKL
jgi:hypothetical protein